MDFKLEYESKKKRVDEAIGQLINKRDIPKKLKEAMIYSLMGGGKRIRPVLMLSSCDLFDGDMDECLPVACAIEMIHTYSLIHDDLPAMDDDTYRRGRLTSHIKFDEATAILAGDALLNLAMELCLDNAIKHENQYKKHILAAQYIFTSSGASGMVAGQVYDMEGEGKNLPIDDLNRIHENKTLKMIVAPLVAGSILSDANEAQIESITQYGKKIGLAFQIQDDILDVVGDFKKLGKNPGSDESNNKSTYVSMMGIQSAKEQVDKLISSAINDIKEYNQSEFLIHLAKFIGKREN